MLSFEKYAKQRRLALGESIKDHKKIYLDTKYWVDLCDTSLGKNKNETSQTIFFACKKLVEKKKAIFPISYRVFIEVLRQSDETSLFETVKVIDLFSEGVTLLSEDERLDYELLHFIYSQFPDKTLHETDTFVWSKVPYVLGLVKSPDLPFVSDEENVTIQQRFFDHMWNISLTEMITTMGMDVVKAFPKTGDFSVSLNQRKKKAENENNTLHATYMSEIAGILDVFREKAKETLKYLYQNRKMSDASEDESLSADIQPFLNIIYHAFDQNKMDNFLPSFDIMAKLHAAIRWNKTQPYKANGFDDIGHSYTALPYFDYFFTERSFGTLIKQVKYDEKYKCVVAWKPEEVLKCLNTVLDRIDKGKLKCQLKPPSNAQTAAPRLM